MIEDEIERERKVIVKGASRSIDYAALPMFLSLADYKKAIKAQDETRDVKVRCRLKGNGRYWADGYRPHGR